jgi:hypothetical protein
LKRFVLAILSVFYLSSSIGATIHLHYCMDKLVALGLNKSDEKECSNCGMTKAGKDGCCKDDHKHVKIESDQKATESSIFSFDYFSHVTIIPFSEFQIASPKVSSFRLPYSNGPPKHRPTSLYLVNRVFRI